MMRWILSVAFLTVCACGQESGSGNPEDSGPSIENAEADTGSNSGRSAGAAYTSGWTQGQCNRETMLDVSSAPGPDENGLMPMLTVTCEGDEMVVVSNDIPHFTFTPLTPNELAETNYEWRIPIDPQLAGDISEIPLLGTVAFTVTGLSINGANEGPMPDPYGDPVLNGLMDNCQGHTGMDYHVHSMNQQCFVPSGLIAEPWTNPPIDTTQPSPILGWALDGFPIYGSHGCVDEACSSVIEFLSSWDNTSIQEGTEGCTDSDGCAVDKVCGLVMQDGSVVTACADKDYAWQTNAYTTKSGTNYLDQCNGRVQPDGTYGYHITSTFPYTLGCYRGTATGAGPASSAQGEPAANSSGQAAGGGMMPPQAAIDACDGLSEGDVCMTTVNGNAISGTCQTPPNQTTLACRP